MRKGTLSREKTFVLFRNVVFASLFLILTTGVFSYDLMIICPVDFEEALEPLVTHKAKTGVSARIVTLGDISTTYFTKEDGTRIVDAPERIKYAIYDHYKHQGVRYVMLVGDGNQFPIRYTRGYLDDYTPNDTYAIAEMIWEPSDLYYADIVDSSGNFESWDDDDPRNDLFGEIYRADGVNWDSLDYLPDVYLARVPASGVSELENYVAKIIRYEYLTTSEPWFQRILCSARSLHGWDPINTFETLITDLSSQGFSPIRLYHDEFYNLIATPTATPTPTPFPPYPAADGNPNPGNFNYWLNQGIGFLFHSGHGNPTAWTHGCYEDTNVPYNSNWDRLPIVFAVSCETARYCPYVPYDDYRRKTGGEQTEVDRYSIGAWICPEPSSYQVDSYNRHCLGEEFTVEKLGGAIAYFGCVNTGERQSLYLGRRFFSAYSPGVTLGEMWMSALNDFYSNYNLSRYGHDTSGGNGDTWIFHHPERFHIFGDPSLKVGGCPLLSLDETPPVTTHNVDRDWYQNRFTLELNATDSGCGVRRTNMNVVGTGSWHDYRSYDFSVSYGEVETYTVQYKAEDYLQNEEDLKEVIIRLDYKNPHTPSIALEGDGPTIADADYGGPVTVTVDCTDDDSGMRYLEYILYKWNHWYEEYSVCRRDYMIPPFPWVFTINEPGQYRLTVWGTDNAGNDSSSSMEEFTTIWVDTDPWFRDMAHILQGPAMLALPPKLEFPFTPDVVRFFIRQPGQQWGLVGVDQNPQDGWSTPWDTFQYMDAIYDMKATAVHFLPGTRKEELHDILMGRSAVMNRDQATYEFQLTEEPQTADRGEAVEHKIVFTNKDKSKLNNLEILFDLAGSKQYDTKKVEIHDSGTMDKDGVIHWTLASLEPEKDWTVGFKACSTQDIPSGESVCSYAFFRCDEIPIGTSDNPSTPKDMGDPSCFDILAKDGKVSGRVFDSYLLQPLEGTTVTLQGHGIAVTDPDGFYLFNDVIAGKHELEAENPPAFGKARATAVVDGTSITKHLYLPRNDLVPPKGYLAGTLQEYVSKESTVFSGKAKDDPIGSGVKLVEASFLRFSDTFFWDGTGWNKEVKWFTAKGTEDWTLSLEKLLYDKSETYRLMLKVQDAEGNTGTSEFFSQPPAPKGLKTEKLKSRAGQNVKFSWDAVPGSTYLLEVTNQPVGGEAAIYKYLGKNQYETSSPLPGGVYYWRVYAMIGNNVSEASDTQVIVLPPWGESSGVILY